MKQTEETKRKKKGMKVKRPTTETRKRKGKKQSLRKAAIEGMNAWERKKGKTKRMKGKKVKENERKDEKKKKGKK